MTKNRRKLLGYDFAFMNYGNLETWRSVIRGLFHVVGLCACQYYLQRCKNPEVFE